MATSLTASKNRGVSAAVENVANVPRMLTTESNGKPPTKLANDFRPVRSKAARIPPNASKPVGLSGPS